MVGRFHLCVEEVPQCTGTTPNSSPNNDLIQCMAFQAHPVDRSTSGMENRRLGSGATSGYWSVCSGYAVGFGGDHRNARCLAAGLFLFCKKGSSNVFEKKATESRQHDLRCYAPNGRLHRLIGSPTPLRRRSFKPARRQSMDSPCISYPSCPAQ